jgi:hypothetical protein
LLEEHQEQAVLATPQEVAEEAQEDLEILFQPVSQVQEIVQKLQ